MSLTFHLVQEHSLLVAGRLLGTACVQKQNKILGPYVVQAMCRIEPPTPDSLAVPEECKGKDLKQAHPLPTPR